MRSQARALVGKGVRALAEGTGSIQDRVAAALPESGWLANDKNAYGALNADEQDLLQQIRTVGSKNAVMQLSDEEAAELAHIWWLLLDSLSTTG